MMKYRRGQLFLIEVIIALSVLVILVGALFSIQSYSPPVESNNLRDNGNTIIENMVETGMMYDYLEKANYSRYVEGDLFLDPQNATKLEVKNLIVASIPAIANYKVFTERYNESNNQWESIDSVNFEQSLPTGSDLTLIEYYTPGFNGNYAQFKFKLYLWFEVSG